MTDVFQIANIIDHSTHSNMVKTTITLESEWDPFALGAFDNIGLGQLRLVAGKDLSDTITHEDLYNPVTNAFLTTAIIEKLMDKYHNNKKIVRMAYTHGEYHSLFLDAVKNISRKF